MFTQNSSKSAVGAELPQGQQVLMLKNLAIFKLKGVEVLARS